MTENKNEGFEKVVQYFFHKKAIRPDVFTLETVSDKSPSTRILRTYFQDRRRETYVVKIPQSVLPSDKDPFHTQNEIRMQSLLRSIGLSSKDYSLVGLNLDNPLGFPFTVSTFLPGRNLDNANNEEISVVAPKVLDYLYRLHSRFQSESYGYLQDDSCDKPVVPYEQFESSYLLSDIERDGIMLTSREQDDLNRAIMNLSKAAHFCLCHCDVTLRNTLVSGEEVHLIDWTYSHYTKPDFDIANVIFWLADFRLKKVLSKELGRSSERYKDLNLDIVPDLLYYLAQRYIEYGRIKGNSYIDRGKLLLRYAPALTLFELNYAIHRVMD